MEECNICLTKIKKRNKNKQNQSKRHKYFSNLIINKYIVKKMKLINLKISFNHTTMSMKRNSINFLYVLCGRKMKCL